MSEHRIRMADYAPRFETLKWEDVEILLRAALDDDEALDAAACLKESGYIVGKFVDPLALPFGEKQPQ